MRRAAQASAEAHVEVMKAARPGMSEFDVQNLIEFEFKRRGCARPAYGSIVAGGPHATFLHYVNNDAPLLDGELLLIDAGGEFEMYAADITRVFPVGKRFTAAQAKVYDVVLRAQKVGIELARPGVPLIDIHNACVLSLTEGMVELGLLRGKPRDLIQSGAYRKYYMHRTSHWLGLDVHDTGDYCEGTASRRLAEGCVITIEPGLYVASDEESAPEEFRGIGIRIEDDVLITASGHEVLTAAVPKERGEIEALRA
jgi:Xaa-Pro aminopeptidase